ncbi:hypothetical protein DN069_13465 [Streptacidiphilus pinicola]|uniref:diacylglycerol O-acyltransferase n=1 Tax=Streptacidiphilus pinicola TaxID=2219663 RepID=A0A2X0KE16_9ACTN|nr:wax ester/triacylglycerol synthase domain-containing protein [Streptacidiphilus pinicola]RAG85130.1 hypothetical protein DN069_13465 [Streptacidiphilus pinicola]
MFHSASLTPLDELMTRWPFSPSVAGVAVTCEGPMPAASRIAELVRERLGPFPRLGWVLTPPGGPRLARRHRWVPQPDFDVADQIVFDSGAQSFQELALRLMTEPLSPDRPPWRLHVLPEPDGSGFTLLMRAHHSLLDGRSFTTLFRALLDDVPAPPTSHATRTEQRPLQRIGSVTRALRTSFSPGTAVPMPNHGPSSPAYAWCAVPPQVFERARAAVPGHVATATEVFVAAAAGTFRSHLGSWPPASGPERSLFVAVPMDMRRADQGHRLGNAFGAARVPLPVATEDPVARLAACRGLVRSGEHQAALRFGNSLLRALSLVGPRLVDAILAPQYDPAYSAGCCTSLPLTGEGLAFDRHPLRQLRGFPMVPPHGTATFFLLGCSEGYTLNVATNSGSGDARLLADSMLRELHQLAAHAQGVSRYAERC